MATTSQLSNLRTVVLEHLVMLWRRRLLAICVCWAVCLVGWMVVMAIPRQYMSSARAFIDVNGLLTPLLKGMIVDPAGGQSAAYLQQTLLSRPNLEQAAVLANIGFEKQSRHEREVFLNRMATVAKLKAGESNNLFTVTYEDRNPITARNVVRALVTIFAENASRSSRVEMEKARKFLDGQIAADETHLRAAEQRRADFDKQYADYLPDKATGTPRAQVLEQQIAQLKQQYGQAEMTRDALAAQLKATPALLSVQTLVAGSNGKTLAATPQMRLAEARRTLAELQLHDTERHPDVMAARRDIAALESQAAESRRSGTPDGNSQIPNPVYEQLRLKYIDAETSLPAIKQHLADATADYERVKTLASQMPEIVAKSTDLDRDYIGVKANYDELVKRRQAANLSQAADDLADRTQFRVVDPPSMPLGPSFPNVPLMFSLVLVLGLGAGVAVPLGFAYLRPTFVSKASLLELGLPVLGVVSIVPRLQTSPSVFATPFGLAVSGAGLALIYGGLILVGTGAYRWML